MADEGRPKGPLIPIPAGTRSTTCNGKTCGRQFFWAKHPHTGRNHPVSLEREDCVAPTAKSDGKGISHYAVCPNADDFRTPRTAKGA